MFFGTFKPVKFGDFWCLLYADHVKVDFTSFFFEKNIFRFENLPSHLLLDEKLLEHLVHLYQE